MSAKKNIMSASLLSLLASTAFAASLCNGPADRQYRDCVRMVDSLRPQKPGQARVYAADGSEFTAGQVQWMRGQLRKAARLCATGNPRDQDEAARVLTEIQSLLASHRAA